MAPRRPLARLAVGPLVAWALFAFGASPAWAAGACSEPPPWTYVYPRPGQPWDEIWGCLNDAAWRARAVEVPDASKAAGIIAQCEVEVDRFEGRMVFGGAGPSDARAGDVERRVEQEARRALAAFSGCGAR